MKGMIYMIIYVVKPGDSIYSIAKANGTSQDKIIRENEITDPTHLVVGQTLVITENPKTHTVLSGESVYTIAKKYGVSSEALIKANHSLVNPNSIFVGEKLIIPAEQKKLGTINVNGYVLTTTNMEVLRKTLPHLTFLSIFSYDVMANGSLTTINDDAIITAARNANVAPIMVITNIIEGSGFSSTLAHTILTNQQAQDALIANVLRIMKAKNYYGLNIDFEYIFPYDKESYNNFVRKVTEIMHRQGYIVTTALAPKNSATQRGLLYEAHDYPVHGATVDFVILMTYEWGYVAGPPLPVAPLDRVKKVLDYAVAAIPSKKILMGIPNYGYDWKLPYEPGTRATTISNVEAVNRAFVNKARIEYNTVAQSPFYNYYESGGRGHIVWFEDARSIQAKLMLVNEYKLGGVSYWTLGRYFPQNWLVLESMYNVRKVL